MGRAQTIIPEDHAGKTERNGLHSPYETAGHHVTISHRARRRVGGAVGKSSELIFVEYLHFEFVVLMEIFGTAGHDHIIFVIEH